MVKFVCMSLTEFKMAKNSLTFLYKEHECPFGQCLVAVNQSDKAICHLRFVDKRFGNNMDNLKMEWPGVKLVEESTETGKAVKKAFLSTSHDDILVLLKGSDFQIKVWKSLTEIPVGKTVNYSFIADLINNPKAVRAIAKVVGSNPIAYVIPCHRVVSKSGPSKTCWRTDLRQPMLEYEIKHLTGSEK